MYGFIDYDLITSKLKRPTLNLEIMKMAMYYAGEEGKVCKLVTDLTELDMFEKIFLRAEKTEASEVLKQIPFSEQFILGGKTFSGKYVPLEKNIMEYMIANPNFYNDWFRKKYEDGKLTEKDINSYLANGYYRAFLNGNRLPLPVTKGKGSKLFLYDEDFIGNAEWIKLIDYITDNRVTTIFSLNPLLCKGIKDYIAIREHPRISTDNDIVFDFYIPPKDYDYFFKTYGVILKNIIGITHPVSIYIGKNYINDYYGEDFYEKDLIRVVDFLAKCWNKGVMMKVKVWREPNKFNPYQTVYNRLENLIKQNMSKRDLRSDRENVDFFPRIGVQQFRNEYERFVAHRPNDTWIFSLNIAKALGGQIYGPK